MSTVCDLTDFPLSVDTHNGTSLYCFYAPTSGIIVSNIISRLEIFSFLASLKGPITPWFNMICRDRLQFWWDNLHRLKEIATPEKIEKLNI